jgi:hypothetical protein
VGNIDKEPTYNIVRFHIQLTGRNTMQLIIFPLQTSNLPALANLQDALQLFLDQRVIFIDSSPRRQQLTNGHKEERPAKVYKSATQRLVTIFQQSHRMSPPKPPLEPIGTIDAPTAAVMNGILRNLAVLDTPQADGSDHRATLTNTNWRQRGKTQPELMRSFAAPLPQRHPSSPTNPTGMLMWWRSRINKITELNYFRRFMCDRRFSNNISTSTLLKEIIIPLKE